MIHNNTNSQTIKNLYYQIVIIIIIIIERFIDSVENDGRLYASS